MRSKIFMPGDRPERFDAMVATGADVICLDLEDTVTPSNKDKARTEVAALLAGMPAAQRERIIVRVNGLDSGRCEQDLAAVVAAGARHVNMPKPESGEQVEDFCALLLRAEQAAGAGRTSLLVNIESPRGVRLAHEIAGASDRVDALQIGYADLLEPYGIGRRSVAALAHIRMAVRLAAAEARIDAYDGVFAHLDDAGFFREECEAARDMGFRGKSCFDAAQAAIANEIFTPSATAVAQARRIVEAAKTRFASGEGIFELDGRIVDEPFVIGARRLLQAAAALDGRKA